MNSLTLAVALLLAGCAASGPGAVDTSSESSSPPSAARLAAPSREAADIEISGEFEIRAFAEGEETVVCRREAPLGSRISIERCYPAEPEHNAALDQLQRQALEEMRRRQMLQEQQRRAIELQRIPRR